MDRQFVLQALLKPPERGAGCGVSHAPSVHSKVGIVNGGDATIVHVALQEIMELHETPGWLSF